MNKKPIIWTHYKEKDRYFSDERYEFSIYKEGNFWILSYTDFWSCELEGSVFVNIKSSGLDMFALRRLRKYAQSVADRYEIYLENDKLKDNDFLGTDLTEEERKKLIKEYVKTFRENERKNQSGKIEDLYSSKTSYLINEPPDDEDNLKCPKCGGTDVESKGRIGHNRYGEEIEADWEECKTCGEIFNI